MKNYLLFASIYAFSLFCAEQKIFTISGKPLTPGQLAYTLTVDDILDERGKVNQHFNSVTLFLQDRDLEFGRAIMNGLEPQYESYQSTIKKEKPILEFPNGIVPPIVTDNVNLLTTTHKSLSLRNHNHPITLFRTALQAPKRIKLASKTINLESVAMDSEQLFVKSYSDTSLIASLVFFFKQSAKQGTHITPACSGIVDFTKNTITGAHPGEPFIAQDCDTVVVTFNDSVFK